MLHPEAEWPSKQNILLTKYPKKTKYPNCRHTFAESSP